MSTNIYEHQAAQRARIVSCYSNATDCITKAEETKSLEENKEGDIIVGKEETTTEEK